ncbi:hypothetical protein [Chryseobacterium sp. SC28]|uniref:hypothetical protein n=1 Tax=Chryseobacterium sp. SC28 TaxID=2268028 RepID=UPI000F64D301|nr:hypothetical protein [Chryseobacterium sp. SC28]MCG2791944.1 hypothetical protein [Weeksellaceae bacterium]RRQ44972.1 hypothetical protein DTW91_12675 [Chryseobacterium sp. SC28]
MTPQDNFNEQDRKLREMEYNPAEDIFEKEEILPLDGDGNPIYHQDIDDDKPDKGLDIPGVEDDDEMEEIGSEDEENNYWSTSDNDDDHEEENVDLVE